MPGFSVRNPYLIVVAALVIMLIGGVVLVRMPVDMFPALDSKNQVVFVGDRSRDYIYVFETEEAARKFIDEIRRAGWREPTGFIRRVRYSDADDILKNATTNLPRQQSPVPAAVDRVVPPVPTAPVPQ